MTLQERIQLLNAGYTKDEIESMSSETVENSTVDNSTTVEYNVDEDESDNVESNVESQESEPNDEIKQMKQEFKGFMSTMQKEMQEQIKALQKFNLQHDKIHTIQKESAEDVLAKIINPPKESEEK